MHSVTVVFGTRVCFYQDIMETQPVRLASTVGANVFLKINPIRVTCLFIFTEYVQISSYPLYITSKSILECGPILELDQNN